MDETHDGHTTPSDTPTDDPVDARPAPFTVVPAVQAQPRPEPPRRTRRWFVAGALAVVAGGGAGVGFDFARGRPGRPAARTAPAPLRAALADERSLLAAARAAGALPAAVRDSLVRDHEAHLAALVAAAAAYLPARKTAPDRSSSPGPTRAGLRRFETAAAQRAGERARRLDGDTATLLASIAACEATHAELLS